MFHSPHNGIGILKSKDLTNWTDTKQLLTLGQKDWQWAKGRITAAAVMDISNIAGQQLYIMFFHGSGPEDEQTMFDINASIGLAYSYDMINWKWN